MTDDAPRGSSAYVWTVSVFGFVGWLALGALAWMLPVQPSPAVCVASPWVGPITLMMAGFLGLACFALGFITGQGPVPRAPTGEGKCA